MKSAKRDLKLFLVTIGVLFSGAVFSTTMALTTPDPTPKYKRSEFPHWVSFRGCLNVREEVLVRTAVDNVILDDRGCVVIAGVWDDPYTGTILTDPKLVDIDHIVPLEEAWKSGAYLWTKEQRTAFANDFDNLIATTQKANRTKGAKDPAKWKPRKSYWCSYSTQWIFIKEKYKLSKDDKEIAALETMQKTCKPK